MALVLPLRKNNTLELLTDLAIASEKDEITDLVIMARYRDGRTVRRWFGLDSSFRCLGMAHYAADEISRYISQEE